MRPSQEVGTQGWLGCPGPRHTFLQTSQGLSQPGSKLRSHEEPWERNPSLHDSSTPAASHSLLWFASPQRSMGEVGVPERQKQQGLVWTSKAIAQQPQQRGGHRQVEQACPHTGGTEHVGTGSGVHWGPQRCQRLWGRWVEPELCQRDLLGRSPEGGQRAWSVFQPAGMFCVCAGQQPPSSHLPCCFPSGQHPGPSRD